MDDTLFFKNLLEKHKDLVEISTKKKYTFIVPLAKYITPNMLIRNFYDNHVFYQCDYDPKMYVNLNGRVLEFKNNQFQTFLGFKRQMTFNVIEELMREIMNNVYTKVIYIDNVIDETVYNQSSSVTSNLSKKDTMKRYNNKDDYVKYFGNLVRLNDELKEIEYNLKELIDKLQNNYILIKGHVHTYYKYYQELVSEFRTYLSSKLSKYKLDDAFNTIIHELTESLVFNKIYQFLFLNLKQFNVDEEAELKVKMNNLKNDFSFTIYKLDSVFNECKFRSAVAEIKKISSCSTPFEKFAVLNSVNNFIDKEARECLEKNSFKKKSFQLTTDELLPMWIYVVINSDIQNILSEKTILHDFSLKSGQSENDFILILFIQAIENFRKENTSGNKNYSNIAPIYIQTKTIITEAPPETFMRSQSMAVGSGLGGSSSQNPQNSQLIKNQTMREDPGLLSSMTSKITGIFK